MQVVHGYCQRSRTALAGVQAVTSCIMPPYFKEAQSEADLAQSAGSFLWGLLVGSVIDGPEPFLMIASNGRLGIAEGS